MMTTPKPVSTDLPDSNVSPDPKKEKRTRQVFSPEYKLKIIALADACTRGELRPLHRRGGLYNGQLNQWREELATHGVEGLANRIGAQNQYYQPNRKRLRSSARIPLSYSANWRLPMAVWSFK